MTADLADAFVFVSAVAVAFVSALTLQVDKSPQVAWAAQLLAPAAKARGGDAAPTDKASDAHLLVLLAASVVAAYLVVLVGTALFVPGRTLGQAVARVRTVVANRHEPADAVSVCCARDGRWVIYPVEFVTYLISDDRRSCCDSVVDVDVVDDNE